MLPRTLDLSLPGQWPTRLATTLKVHIRALCLYSIPTRLIASLETVKSFAGGFALWIVLDLAGLGLNAFFLAHEVQVPLRQVYYLVL